MGHWSDCLAGWGSCLGHLENGFVMRAGVMNLSSSCAFRYSCFKKIIIYNNGRRLFKSKSTNSNRSKPIKVILAITSSSSCRSLTTLTTTFIRLKWPEANPLSVIAVIALERQSFANSICEIRVSIHIRNSRQGSARCSLQRDSTKGYHGCSLISWIHNWNRQDKGVVRVPLSSPRRSDSATIHPR